MLVPGVRVTPGGAVKLRVTVVPDSEAPVMLVSPTVPPPEAPRPLVLSL
jgi:hypothetical protein